ncbi:MAG: leucine-rich repeat domain-containing protein [Clostridia bacterium]|nr:leucine-rich repeat domain-containing protein [Clostridia bacterium]
MKKFLLILLLMIYVFVSIFAISTYAANNTCGANLTWSLTDGVLTISGEGEMANYTARGSAPWNSSYVEKIVINDGVTSIGDYAFAHCVNLTEIVFGSTVASIGTKAFFDCYTMEAITIPKNIKTIGNNAFDCCYALKKVTIENGVTTIGAYAFQNCTGLTDITIPKSVGAVSAFSFFCCESLKNVVINNGASSIDNSAFYDCKSLESITIPSSVTKIDYYAFYNCRNLKNVYYIGTESSWNEIAIKSYNTNLLNATIHFQDLAESGISIDLAENIITINTPNAALSAIIPVVMYNNTDGVIDIKYVPIALNAGKNEIASPYDNYQNADAIKIMVWESLESLKPIMNYSEIPIIN